MRRREFITLVGGAAIARPFGARAAAGVDLVVDGVPIPSDANVAASIPKSASNSQRLWSGVWVGAWNGALKHILIVENAGEDGIVDIIYAEADNPYTRARARWWRGTAIVSGQVLTVTASTLTVSYKAADGGQLDGFLKDGSRIARATMSKADLTSLTKPDAVVAWSRGTSEMLQTDVLEDGRPVRLETAVFKPRGSGPFPLAVVNHGSTGKKSAPELAKLTWASIEIADFLNQRGWLVAFPQRRGRGKSDGRYEEGGCNTELALRGVDRALTDLEAAISALRRRQDVAGGPLLIGGQSRGGVLSVVYAGLHPEQTLGVLNFVGGWLDEGCPVSELVNQTLFERGAKYSRSTLWLYGGGDHFYSIAHSKKNFAAFESAGGKGNFFEFDMPSDVGHNVIHYPELWTRPVGDYLNSSPDKG